jgi:hypothetical protein
VSGRGRLVAEDGNDVAVRQDDRWMVLESAQVASAERPVGLGRNEELASPA